MSDIDKKLIWKYYWKNCRSLLYIVIGVLLLIGFTFGGLTILSLFFPLETIQLAFNIVAAVTISACSLYWITIEFWQQAKDKIEEERLSRREKIRSNDIMGNVE